MDNDRDYKERESKRYREIERDGKAVKEGKEKEEQIQGGEKKRKRRNRQ